MNTRKSGPPAASPISAQQAIELARKAAEEAVELHPELPPTVETVGGQHIVTFPHDLAPGHRGADYRARVYVNSRTGEIEKLLVGA